MLKNLLYGQPAEYVALQGYVLTVRTSGPLKSVSTKLRVQQAGREVTVRFRPAAAREIPGGYLYTGLVAEGLHDLAPGIRELAPEEHGFLRAGERVPYSARVLSRELPNFRAVTVDFSPGGLQLETEGPVEVGSVIHLTLDGGYDTPGLTVKARVAWSSAKRAGVEFFFLEQPQRNAIDRIYASLTVGRALSVSDRLASVKRQGADHWASAPVRPLSCSCEGEILGYQQTRGSLTLCLGHRELHFAGLSSVSDRQGSTGSEVSRLEFHRQPAGWLYKLVSPRGGTVLEIACATCPDELLGPDLRA